jgi:hypothetical protein
MTETEKELKVLDEVSFVHPFKRKLRLRHYDDFTWEILDDNDIPVIQGKCGMTAEEYLLQTMGKR